MRDVEVGVGGFKPSVVYRLKIVWWMGGDTGVSSPMIPPKCLSTLDTIPFAVTTFSSSQGECDAASTIPWPLAAVSVNLFCKEEGCVLVHSYPCVYMAGSSAHLGRGECQVRVLTESFGRKVK